MFLDEIYRTNYSMLLQVACTVTSICAEDVVMNAMLSLFSLVPRLRLMEERERVAYLRATVRNAAYKYYNAQKRQNQTELPLDGDHLFSLPADRGDPAELLIEDEEYREVRAAIGALPESDRRVLYLKYAVRLTAEEIATETGAPSAAAVQVRISRARRKVLDWLQASQGGGDGV
ncbi:sigma-70 family RNA polymerase sigma factor [Pseudoflavonifractor phocaeensis]|nr:sigma-70 family RNA polymerase sigma factor [Pseudoflavonifractor phocaeensis]MCQ4862736.1 sigma-70 family RNA polymerase sigma factor [Pseudoflavonifractor phocaeensis]